jgi:hypothetical protein
LNRRTVTAWLKREKPLEDGKTPPTVLMPPPPAAETATPPPPWTSWEEVRGVRAALKKRHSLLLRRPDHRNATEEAQRDDLLNTPIGADLRLARAFLLDWYAIWRDEDGDRREFAEAQERYEHWRASAD